jgi:CheY-like chemotaxis protein
MANLRIHCLMNRAFNILAVEDNADDLFLLREAFKRAAVTSQLNAVSDGIEALAYLSGREGFTDRMAHPFPDILLLDINMPRMNGFEVLEWIRQDAGCSRLVVHVLTASSRQLDVQRAYDLGANSYVVKPSRLDELAAFVKALHEWHRFISAPYEPV